MEAKMHLVWIIWKDFMEELILFWLELVGENQKSVGCQEISPGGEVEVYVGGTQNHRVAIVNLGDNDCN